MSSSNPWKWSPDHNDHYRIDYDENGDLVYIFAKGAGGSQSHAESSAAQSVQQDDAGASVATMPEPLPTHIRETIPNLIHGTPSRGWYDLDTTYRMRTGAEARDFFVMGRVFSMLHAETASETWARNGTENTAITIGRFGQGVYSQIRRFIIVKVEHGFVYAIPIYTYSGRGTTKRGCNAKEHAPAYLRGQSVQYFEGEAEAGMDKKPIEIVPASADIMMNGASRIRFGKTYPVEWNVKVKDIGQVLKKHMRLLYKYWKSTQNSDDPVFSGDEDSDSPTHALSPTGRSAQPRDVHQSSVAETGFQSHTADNTSHAYEIASTSPTTESAVPRTAYLPFAQQEPAYSSQPNMSHGNPAAHPPHPHLYNHNQPQPQYYPQRQNPHFEHFNNHPPPQYQGYFPSNYPPHPDNQFPRPYGPSSHYPPPHQ
ncbi:hypothetical protein B0J11DRAFT_541935 [Dendryphion nanum]|uniref:DUF6590 domain-containing protein n=1 Tax=Dendryphion nanum TaxID=256645 RepID=A0A9P9D5J8_9PLEO|nr:hypothetical protein B0J11DRAFT_541935 [Dendryphion nanum]